MKSAMGASMVALAAAGSHPTLPTMWTATVKEAEVGVVHESEHFVDKPDETNVSAKWTNYTDGSCQRLIRAGYTYDQKAYLLGCDAVDCCTEDHSSPLEYQIPNVHPQWLAPVSNMGKVDITLFDGNKVKADHWAWRFAIAHYNAYTTTANDTTILHRWVVNASGQAYPNEYVNFKVVPADQEAAFLATFAVPAVCKASGVMSCADARKQGKLSEKSMKLLRHDIKHHHKSPKDIVV